MDKQHLSSRLERVYNASDLRDLEQAYDEWASDYDAEVNRLGYLLRSVSTGYIGRHISPHGRVLDAGAGTGLIGLYLGVIGYRDLTAIDLSEGMLEHARAKGCYRELHQMVLGEPLDFPSDSFDGAYAIGVFTEGHAPPGAFEEIARIVRPGGRFVFSIRDDVYRERGYREVQDALEHSGTWRQSDVSPIFRPYESSRPDIHHRIFVYEIT